MSSLAPPSPAITTAASGGINSFSSSIGCSSSLFLRSFKVPIAKNPNRRHAISCKTLDDHDHRDQDSNKVDRRNVLLGLGGLYGAATTFGSNSLALADPILAPDVTKCGTPTDLPEGVKLDCCPPPPKKIIDFKLPPTSTNYRVRPAAHLAKEEYIEKFNRAIALMKGLCDDDPRSFKNQAAVHCAYCDGAYHQADFPDIELQVHSSWLFLPFHRYYLYFFEKICGELLQEPDFAIPFWNWDATDGSQIPDMYTNKKSPLYDPFRDACHQPPALVNFDYNGCDEIISPLQQLSKNRMNMYTHMVRARKTKTFMGDPYRAGDKPHEGKAGPGSLERVPHNTLHRWTGDRTQPNGEDMGDFYSAARDPIFYGHHANVDRMWSVWKTLPGKRKEFTDKDWLDSSFVFYNEKAEMVRVKVSDSVDTKNLGYVYQDVEIPWRHSKPPKIQKRVSSKVVGKMPLLAKDVFPESLNKVIKVSVPRPRKSRNKEEKDAQEEILVIEGIELKKNMYMKFDVFVNDEDEGMGGTDRTEFAGSFVHVPHKHNHGENIKTKMSLEINELLEDLNAEGDDNIMVTLVPKSGGDNISIAGIKIEFD